MRKAHIDWQNKQRESVYTHKNPCNPEAIAEILPRSFDAIRFSFQPPRRDRPISYSFIQVLILSDLWPETGVKAYTLFNFDTWSIN